MAEEEGAALRALAAPFFWFSLYGCVYLFYTIKIPVQSASLKPFREFIQSKKRYDVSGTWKEMFMDWYRSHTVPTAEKRMGIYMGMLAAVLSNYENRKEWLRMNGNGLEVWPCPSRTP